MTFQSFIFRAFKYIVLVLHFKFRVDYFFSFRIIKHFSIFGLNPLIFGCDHHYSGARYSKFNPKLNSDFALKYRFRSLYIYIFIIAIIKI